MATFARERGCDRGNLRNQLNKLDNFTSRPAPALRFRVLEPETDKRRRLNSAAIQPAEGDMTIDRALLFSILMAAIAAAGATPALAQACTREATP